MLTALRRVAEVAKRTVPDCDDASVTVVSQGMLSTPVATGPTALEAGRVQYRSGRGPCVDAILRAEVVPIERRPLVARVATVNARRP